MRAIASVAQVMNSALFIVVGSIFVETWQVLGQVCMYGDPRRAGRFSGSSAKDSLPGGT